MDSSTFQNESSTILEISFGTFDFSFLGSLKSDTGAQVPESKPKATVAKSQPPSAPGAPKPLECRGCFAAFPFPGFKVKYCVTCEPDAKARQRLQLALDALKPKPVLPTPQPTAARSMEAPQSSGQFRLCSCGKLFELLFMNAPHIYCVPCVNLYKRSLAKKKAADAVVADARVTPRAVMLAPQQQRAEADRKLKTDLREAFLKNAVPEGIIVTRMGTQTVFELTDGRSLTLHIPKTETELAAEADARKAAEAARREAEAKAEVERKKRAAESAEAKAAKNAAKKGGKSKKG